MFWIHKIVFYVNLIVLMNKLLLNYAVLSVCCWFFLFYSIILDKYIPGLNCVSEIHSELSGVKYSWKYACDFPSGNGTMHCFMVQMSF